MKKEEIASKMKGGKCAVCGRSHDKGVHKKNSLNRREVVEGDAAAHLGPQDKFSERDEAKEKRMRKAKSSQGFEN